MVSDIAQSTVKMTGLLLTFTLYIFAATVVPIAADGLPPCGPSDFHYVYTECDSNQERWRVAVPKPAANCENGTPPPPIPGQKCDFTCPEGSFLDIQSDQTCKNCMPGTYSMGGGVRYDDWENLPGGFSVAAEPFSPEISHVLHSYGVKGSALDVNCTEGGWKPVGKFISSLATDCAATLQLTTNLVKPGELRFMYQYTDTDAIFHFIAQSNCQSEDDKTKGGSWPVLTEEYEWGTVTVPLKSGNNILYWKTLGVSKSKGGRPKPIKIKRIEISGIAYTQECTKCPAGTSSVEGASRCSDCPVDHYSDKGASQCTACDSVSEYAARGSSKCLQRPECTVDDYFQYNSPCDENQQTKVMYKWIEPKICTGGVSLPDSGVPEPCSPCNPGMELVEGACQFCKPNFFSDGTGSCQQCPPSTAPEYSLTYKWWQNIPVEGNISATCLSMSERGCASENGWQMASDHIHSGRGHADDAYLVLSAQVGGFKGNEQFINGKAATVGKISFVFELQCTGSCSFYFMQQAENTGTSVIEEWSGSQGKQQYTFDITKTEEVSFSWAFQKLSTDEMVNEEGGKKYNLKNDRALIYAINITNTLSGGATHCKSCPKGTQENTDSCIPCPPGQYIDTNTTQCFPCPKGEIVRGISPWGRESCVKCGEGLTAKDGIECVSTCTYQSPNREYDFTALPKVMSVDGTRLFTSSGTEYYHLFNISLCGQTQATCLDNITALAAKTNESNSNENNFESVICRSTILPPKPGDKSDTLAAQPVSIGDYLMKITSDSNDVDLKNLTDIGKEGFEKPKDGEDEYDVHFIYKSEMPTPACKNGRSTVITLRCDITEDEEGSIDLPPKCNDGTCNGCNFHFLWKTRVACPVCKSENYQEVIGECKDGEQLVHYIPQQHCAILGGGKEIVKTRACSVLPFWLQVSILAGSALGFLLLILVIYCWKRNRKLEYKYTKLIATSGKDGELPAPDSCGISEGEDDEEQYDRVHFKSKSNILHKFMGKNGKDDQAIMLSEEEEI